MVLSHNYLFTFKANCWSLVMFTLLCSPWDPYKLCWTKKKLFYLLKILSRKPSFFFNLTDWHKESLQCWCRTIPCLHLKLIVGHWWCLPCFICLEILINFVKIVFYLRFCLESHVFGFFCFLFAKDLSLFYMFNF